MKYQQIIVIGLGLIGNAFAGVTFDAGKIKQKVEANISLKLDKVCSKDNIFAPATTVVVNYPEGIARVSAGCKSGCDVKSPSTLRRRGDLVPTDGKSVELINLSDSAEVRLKFLAPAYNTKDSSKNTIEFNLDITCGNGFNVAKDSDKAILEVAEKDAKSSGSMITYSAFTFFGLSIAYYL